MSEMMPDPVEADPDYPVDPVPREARQSALSVVLVLLGFVFYMPTMLAGAEMGAALAFDEFLIAVLIGSTILALTAGILGAIGSHTGVTAPVFARYVFGVRGAKISSLILGIVLVGWFGVDVGFFSELLAESLGWTGSLATTVLMVLSGALMTSTAYYGFKGMYWLSAVSIGPLIILAIWVAIRSWSEVGGLSGLSSHASTGEFDTMAGVTMTVGTFITGAVVVANWSRFALRPKQAFWTVLAVFFLGNGLMVAFGGLGGMAFDQEDFVLVLYELGLVAFGVFLLIGSTWTSADNDVYGSAIAAAEFFNGKDKRPFVIAVGVIGTVLAVSGIYDGLTTFLTWLGLLIPPIGGALIGDWLMRWRQGIPHPREAGFHSFRWGPSVAYVLGAAVAVVSNEFDFGIPPLNGLLVALVLTILANWTAGRATEQLDPGKRETRVET